MLDREGQRLDLQEIWLSELTVDIDAEGMSGELGIKPCDIAPKGMGMVGLDVELFGELTVDRLDDLAHGVVEPLLVPWAAVVSDCIVARCAVCRWLCCQSSGALSALIRLCHQ